MKTTSTTSRRTRSAFSVPGVGSPCSSSISRPPTSGNVAQTARFVERRVPGAARARPRRRASRRRRSPTAGAGPSSAIASTSARNEPEMRSPRISIVSDVAADREDEQQQDELDRLPVARLGGRRRPRRRDAERARRLRSPEMSRSTSCHDFRCHRSALRPLFRRNARLRALQASNIRPVGARQAALGLQMRARDGARSHHWQCGPSAGCSRRTRSTSSATASASSRWRSSSTTGPARWRPRRRSSSPRKFLPALLAPLLTARLDQVALRRIAAGALRRSRRWCSPRSR